MFVINIMLFVSGNESPFKPQSQVNTNGINVVSKYIWNFSYKYVFEN